MHAEFFAKQFSRAKKIYAYACFISMISLVLVYSEDRSKHPCNEG